MGFRKNNKINTNIYSLKENTPIRMETIDNKTIVRKYVEEVLNTGDVAKIHHYVAEDYEEVHEGVRHKLGIDGAKEHILGIRRVYPDLYMTIENQISEGEWIATSYTVTGTFKEEWLGLKPSGETISYKGVNVDRIKGGKIIEHGGAANLLDPLLKSGVIEKKK